MLFSSVIFVRSVGLYENFQPPRRYPDSALQRNILNLFSVLLRVYLFIIYYIYVNDESKHANISGEIHSFGLYLS